LMCRMYLVKERQHVANFQAYVPHVSCKGKAAWWKFSGLMCRIYFLKERQHVASSPRAAKVAATPLGDGP
ncbi:hypothetical protein AVEN_255715-1, partial [Araneus ventricosus]